MEGMTSTTTQLQISAQERAVILPPQTCMIPGRDIVLGECSCKTWRGRGWWRTGSVCWMKWMNKRCCHRSSHPLTSHSGRAPATAAPPANWVRSRDQKMWIEWEGKILGADTRTICSSLLQRKCVGTTSLQELGLHQRASGRRRRQSTGHWDVDDGRFPSRLRTRYTYAACTEKQSR